MDGRAGGEAKDPIVLHDEDGQAFALRPLRALRDDSDLFLLAERDRTGTLEWSEPEGRPGAAIVEDLTANAAGWAGLLPSLESRTLGMRGERVEVTDARGVAHAYRAAGRLFFQGRDLLFLSPEHDLLVDLHAHVERSTGAGSAR